MKAGGKSIYRQKLGIRLFLTAIIVSMMAYNLVYTEQISWLLMVVAVCIVIFIWYSHVELNDYILSNQLGLQNMVLGWENIVKVEVFRSFLYLGLACRITYVNKKGRLRRYVFSHLDKMDLFVQDLSRRAKKAKIISHVR